MRNYESKDLQDLERFVVGLQDYENQLEFDRIPGNQVAKKYVGELLVTAKIFILEVNQKTVGFSAGYVSRDDEIISTINKFMYLSDIYIEPKYRNQDLSKYLFEKVEEYARSLNLKYIKLNVLFKNEVMRNVVNKIGFREHELVYLKQLPS